MKRNPWTTIHDYGMPIRNIFREVVIKKNLLWLMTLLVLLIFQAGYTQKMTVKDTDSNLLMQVNDEGTVGSITLEDSTVAPSTTTNKLYNVGGSLYWNGAALGMSGSAGGWTDGGTSVYTTTSTDKVAIGTATSEFKLTVDNDGGIIARGTSGSGADLTTSGEGTRLIWYPKKAAFRAGDVNGSQWNDANIGNCSTAMGSSTKATSYISTAMGQSTTASGSISTAMGSQTTASGVYSTAMGYNTTASGNRSMAMGDNTTADAFSSTAMGTYNVGGGTADDWVATDPLFEIGIGTGSGARANAVTVLKNGRMGIMTATPQGELDVNGAIYQRGGVLHSDYVFEEDYELESIKEHAAYMWENKHLKAIPKKATDEEGREVIEVGRDRRGIVEELEKAHIYIEQLSKSNEQLQSRIETLESLVMGLRK